MIIIEAHGYRFKAEGHGIDERTSDFAAAAHNVRQHLLMLSPSEVKAMHEEASVADLGGPGGKPGLQALADFADEAAALLDGQFITLRPV